MKWRLALALLGASGAASAQETTYDYTGNPFTDVAGQYTTSDLVSVSITLAAPLGDNLNLDSDSETPLSFTFSDGVQTITPANADYPEFHFSTNSAGVITQWDVQAQTPSDSLIVTDNEMDKGGPAISDHGQVGISGNDFGTVQDDLGVWTEQSATAAPELDPASTASALTLLAGVLLVIRGRRTDRSGAVRFSQITNQGIERWVDR